MNGPSIPRADRIRQHGGPLERKSHAKQEEAGAPKICSSDSLHFPTLAIFLMKEVICGLIALEAQ